MTAAELETLAVQHGDEHTAQYKPTYYDQTDVELAYKAGFHKMLDEVYSLLKGWEGGYVGEFPSANYLLEAYKELIQQS